MRLQALIRKEFRQFRRDRRMVVMAVMAPIIQLTLLGYAADLDVQDLPVAVCDDDRSAESARLVAEIAHAGYFVVSAEATRSADLVALLDRGEAQLALHIPYGFQSRLRAGEATVQLLVDASDANTAGIGAGYLNGLIAEHGARVLARRVRSAPAERSGPEIDLRTRVLYNPTLESVYYMVPGVLGLVLLVITTNLTSLSVVKEREAGTLEQVMVTPLRPWELMLGKLVPFALVATADMATVMAVILLWFRVPMQGSYALLFAALFLFLLTCLGTGLLVSTVSRTQQQAQMTTFFIMLPSMLLSGFMYPIHNMPEWLQLTTYAIPLRYFLTVIRSVMLKGSGVGELWPELAALLAFAVLLVAAGAASFRKRLQ
ncbi:MAG: ABC transporter permease [Armatimonadetes bacterium]|nr:ABC transporter permease [Armatimonadota bacterium]